MSDCPDILELSSFCVDESTGQSFPPPCYRKDPMCSGGFDYWILLWIFLTASGFALIFGLVRFLIFKFRVYITKIAIWVLFLGTVGCWVGSIPLERDLEAQLPSAPPYNSLEVPE